MIRTKTILPCLALGFLLLASDARAGLIVNGDFEAGNTGFVTQYVFSNGTGIGSQQVYDILKNPFPAHPSAASYGDHTTGTGYMMAVNESTTANRLVWGETVAVVPNSDYQFSAFISSWVGTAPSKLDVLFNGTSIGVIQAPSTTATWVQFMANWNSGGASSVNIQLRNLTNADVGGDFALDDISLNGPAPAASSVPEPASIVYALVGLCLVGGILIRTRLRESVPVKGLLCAAVLFLGSSNASAGPFTLYVVNRDANNVYTFDASGNPTLFASSGLNSPQTDAFDAAGNLYVASFNTNAVRLFSPTGTDLGNFASTGMSGPAGLAFDGSGNLYVANFQGGTIRKFGPTGTDLGDFASGLSGPTDLAFDALGNLYVTNQTGNTVGKFAPNGTDLGTFANTGLNAPWGLAFDAAGNLYVANQFGHTIRKFGPTGTDLGDFATTGLSFPTDLAFDLAGNLYVTNLNTDSIRKFGPTGTDLGNFATTGLNRPVGLAFGPDQGGLPLPPSSELVPVPEPSSIVYALGGLVFLGGASLRARLWRAGIRGVARR